MIAPVPLRKLLVDQPVPPHWLVEGVFPRGLLMVLAGDPGAGKTALSQYLTHCVALGRPFLGHTTAQVPVCYFDEENSEVDFTAYNRRIWQGLGSPDAAQYGNRLNFYHFALSSAWYDEMYAVVKSIHPGLIVIDTASPVLDILDENDNSEANRAIKKLRHIQKIADNETNILILKHERQRDDTQHRRTIRGAKVWLGSVDRTFYHIIPRGCRARKDGLRRTVLAPDKLRSFGLEFPLGIDPSWTDASRNGLIFNAYSVKSRDVEPDEET